MESTQFNLQNGGMELPPRRLSLRINRFSNKLWTPWGVWGRIYVRDMGCEWSEREQKQRDGSMDAAESIDMSYAELFPFLLFLLAWPPFVFYRSSTAPLSRVGFSFESEPVILSTVLRPSCAVAATFTFLPSPDAMISSYHHHDAAIDHKSGDLN